MKPLNRFLTLAATTLAMTACSQIYNDEVRQPSEQEMSEARELHPQGGLTKGVFHMKRVNTASSVRVEPKIRLRRPDLPPFDVAYVSRDMESVLLELANAAGESIVIPPSIRGRTVTLIHSGANFPDMLGLVLAKAGYHYNYVNGIWYITRYPIRNYQVEISQSNRSGSLISDLEVSRQANEGTEVSADVGSAAALNTEYVDKIWDDITSTLDDLVIVGSHLARDPNLRSAAAAAAALAGDAAPGTGAGAGAGAIPPVDVLQLPPPSFEGDAASLSTIDPFSTTDSGGIRPNEGGGNVRTDQYAAEDKAEPFFRITRSAGLITVRASPEAHRLVEDYLEEIQQNLNRQIYVEVRIVAVIRDKITDRGTSLAQNVNLGDPFGTSIIGTLGFDAVLPITNPERAGGFVSLGSSRNDLRFIIQALSNLGDVYTISSPSMMVRNNQIGRVAITRQVSFVETQVETNTSETGVTSISSRRDTVKTKNVGTVFSLIPYIGRDKIQMRVRLSQASQSGDVEVRTSIGAGAPVVNTFPILSNNLIDQDIIMDYGRVYSIGSIIETSTSIDHDYMPGLANIPGMAEVFQRARNRKQDTEFLVLMRVSRS
jgi:type II secretory pathway component GspD/PulD (secretin)